MLRLKNVQRLDLEFMNEQLQEMYDRNQALMEHADEIMEPIK